MINAGGGAHRREGHPVQCMGEHFFKLGYLCINLKKNFYKPWLGILLSGCLFLQWSPL